MNNIAALKDEKVTGQVGVRGRVGHRKRHSDAGR